MIRYGNDIVIITVGAEGNATEFYVHADLIVENSDLLALELKEEKDYAERNPQTLTLRDQSAAEFGIFVSFLYTNYVYSASPKEEDKVELDCLLKLWFLAQHLQSTSFKDAITDAFIEKARASDIKEHLLGICDSLFLHVKGESGLGQWLVEKAASWLDPSEWESIPFKPEHTRFFFEALKALAGMKAFSTYRGDEVYEREEGCGYHEHGKGPCGRKLRVWYPHDIRRDHETVLK